MGNQEKDHKEDEHIEETSINKEEKSDEIPVTKNETIILGGLDTEKNAQQVIAVLEANETPEPYLSPVKQNLGEEFKEKDLEKFTSNGVKDLREAEASRLRFISFLLGKKNTEASKVDDDNTLVGTCIIALPQLIEDLNSYLSGLKKLTETEASIRLKDLQKLYEDNFPTVSEVPLTHMVKAPKFYNVMALFAQRFFGEPVEQLIGSAKRKEIDELQSKLVAGQIEVPALCEQVKKIILRNPDFQKTALLELVWQYASRELNNKVALAETVIAASQPTDFTIDADEVEIKNGYKNLLSGTIPGVEKVLRELTEFESEINKIS